MDIGRSEGPKRGHPSQELNGLQFTAKMEFDHIAQRKTVGRRQRESLQRMRAIQGRAQGRFRMVKANEGSLPSSILWLKEARRTEAGETPPYPMLPCNPIVSEEKIDRSSEKPVPKSEALPKPSAAEPATRDRLPLKSCSLFCASPPKAG